MFGESLVLKLILNSQKSCLIRRNTSAGVSTAPDFEHISYASALLDKIQCVFGRIRILLQ